MLFDCWEAASGLAAQLPVGYRDLMRFVLLFVWVSQ